MYSSSSSGKEEPFCAIANGDYFALSECVSVAEACDRRGIAGKDSDGLGRYGRIKNR